MSDAVTYIFADGWRVVGLILVVFFVIDGVKDCINAARRK